MVSTIIWVGFSQSLFAAIIIAAKKKPEIQDRILSAWLFLLAIEFITCGIDILIWGEPLLSSSFLLFNPAFYLYIKSLTKPGFKLKWLQTLHLLPFIIFESGAYILREKYSIHDFFESDTTTWFRYYFSVASVISWFLYNFCSARMVYYHRKRLETEFSNIDYDKNLKWIIFVVVFYNLFGILSMLIAGLNAGLSNFWLKQYIYNYSALLVLIYILGFYGLRQSAIYLNLENGNSGSEETKTSDKEKEKYSQSSLSEERKLEIKESIIAHMENNKPYLHPDFNMRMFSEQLNIPPYHITEVLSTELGKNFYHLVNEYRVNEVIKNLNFPGREFSIEGIGYDAGFSSKSTFFTVFKRFTGFSPLKFKEKIEKEK